MATRKTRNTRAHAKSAASKGGNVRGRVRNLTVDAFRDRNLSLNDVPRLVNEVLDGAVKGVDSSIPQSSKNVLREVFDGLREGVNGIASAGSATAKDVRGRARTVGKDASHAATRVRAANSDFLDAVRDFAGSASREVRQTLDALVDRAERTSPKVKGSARRVADATNGRLGEVPGETVRAGARMARRTASALTLGASGFLEGLAETIKGREKSTTSRGARPTTVRTRRVTRTKKTTKRRKS